MAKGPSSSPEAICQNDYDLYGLIDSPRTLERGFLGMCGSLIVEEGTVAVLTEDGKYVRTLPPGKYALRSFQFGSQLRAYTVHTALHTFMFKANNHFRIYEKSAKGRKTDFPVNVSLAVEFRVNTDKAHILVASGHRPVYILCTRMTSIIWNKLSQIGYDAFCGSGSLLAQEILGQLRHDDVEGKTGLTVENVLPIAFDGADDIGQKIKESVLQGYDTLREMGFSELDIWIIRNPTSLLAGKAAATHELRKIIIEKLLDKGYALSFINTLVEGGDISTLLNTLLGGASVAESIPQKTIIETTPPLHNEATPVSQKTIDREWDALEQLVGVGNLNGHPTTSGIRDTPDGGYLFTITFSDARGTPVTVSLRLLPGYGNGVPPIRTVQRNGVAEDYPGVDPTEWQRSPQLTNLVEEVRRTYS